MAWTSLVIVVALSALTCLADPSLSEHELGRGGFISYAQNQPERQLMDQTPHPSRSAPSPHKAMYVGRHFSGQNDLKGLRLRRTKQIKSNLASLDEGGESARMEQSDNNNEALTEAFPEYAPKAERGVRSENAVDLPFSFWQKRMKRPVNAVTDGAIGIDPSTYKLYPGKVSRSRLTKPSSSHVDSLAVLREDGFHSPDTPRIAAHRVTANDAPSGQLRREIHVENHKSSEEVAPRPYHDPTSIPLEPLVPSSIAFQSLSETVQGTKSAGDHQNEGYPDDAFSASDQAKWAELRSFQHLKQGETRQQREARLRRERQTRHEEQQNEWEKAEEERLKKERELDESWLKKMHQLNSWQKREAGIAPSTPASSPNAASTHVAAAQGQIPKNHGAADQGLMDKLRSWGSDMSTYLARDLGPAQGEMPIPSSSPGQLRREVTTPDPTSPESLQVRVRLEMLEAENRKLRLENEKHLKKQKEMVAQSSEAKALVEKVAELERRLAETTREDINLKKEEASLFKEESSLVTKYNDVQKMNNEIEHLSAVSNMTETQVERLKLSIKQMHSMVEKREAEEDAKWNSLNKWKSDVSWLQTKLAQFKVVVEDATQSAPPQCLPYTKTALSSAITTCLAEGPSVAQMNDPRPQQAKESRIG